MSPEQRAAFAARFHESWFGDGLVDDILGRMALQSSMQRLDRAARAGFVIAHSSVRDHSQCLECIGHRGQVVTSFSIEGEPTWGPCPAGRLVPWEPEGEQK